VVIEACMVGEEASFFALTDGTHYILLATAQDHKRAGDGDTGPNTGGMGAYGPAPLVTPEVHARVCREVIEPTLAGMRKEGHPYRGILYAGLMMTAAGPRVVEFNCRLGDPEAQVVLPLLENDLVDVFTRLVEGRLATVEPARRPGSSACVVMASGGYPGSYEKGKPIDGIAEAAAIPGVEVFQAGTREDDSGKLVTSGGRVLAVSALGADLSEALEAAYRGVGCITFEGAYYRSDIGQKGLARLVD
jgi:phosphoribosylamine--glycine ligase